VILPAAVMARLVEHLVEHVGPERDALVFTGPQGRALRRSYQHASREADEAIAAAIEGRHQGVGPRRAI
jgi:hypothetical protein